MANFAWEGENNGKGEAAVYLQSHIKWNSKNLSYLSFITEEYCLFEASLKRNRKKDKIVQSSPMNGGNGMNSYSKNSTMQRNAASVFKEVMKKALMENLDVEKLLSGSARFAIADYGCLVGPNTFFTMQTLIETVENRYHEQGHDPKNILEFQIFFNDQIGNDFNTLFASIPHTRNYFAAGVAGSFHGRILPSSSYALHWLSKLPEELVVRDSLAWNGGRIHYTGASDAVRKAYMD